MAEMHAADARLPDPRQLDVIILTLNEELNLPACLASLASLECTVYVVDSGSTDNTLALARAAGANVYSNPFESYGQQRNWALQALPLRSEWILNLDADERLTPELAVEIAATIAQGPVLFDGYRLRRRTVFMGRWIRYGGHYPNYQLRLFRRSKGACEDRRYDQHFVVNGPVSSLRNDYIDVTASGLPAWSARHIRWAAAEAEELTSGAGDSGLRVHASLTEGPIARKRWLRDILYAKTPLFVRPIGYFLYRYFFRLGFLDGREGLIFHFLQGFWFRFLVDSIIFERQRFERHKEARHHPKGNDV